MNEDVHCRRGVVDVAGALRTRHNPRPSAFTVRLSHGLRMQLRVGQQAANNLSSGSVRRTGRSLQSGGAYDSRAARQRSQESDTQFTDRNNVTVYCVL